MFYLMYNKYYLKSKKSILDRGINLKKLKLKTSLLFYLHKQIKKVVLLERNNNLKWYNL